MRKEICKRRKEKCKNRREEAREHDVETHPIEKKRKLNEEGNFKIVKQMKKQMREKPEIGGEDQRPKKRRKEQTVKFLGPIEKDAELCEEVDWEKRLTEIYERRNKEKQERERKIKKAEMLERGWALTRECRKLLMEIDKNWQEKREEREQERKRQEMIQKAKNKQVEFKEKQKLKEKERKIGEMLEKIP